jgi:hypothetical protein
VFYAVDFPPIALLYQLKKSFETLLVLAATSSPPYKNESFGPIEFYFTLFLNPNAVDLGLDN